MQTGEDKRAARTRALARRAGAFAAHGATAGESLAAHGLAFLQTAPGAIVSGFSVIRDEIDPAALLARLGAAGYRLCLPVMQGKGLPLVFRAWSPGDAMGKVQWGIAEPLADKPVLEPDVVLVPLLAFDSTGYRLGYGGGFYDRTLARLRAIKPVVAVGVAYDELKVDAVPHQAYDQPLDWVLTPSGPLRCSGS
ncbi:MAG: 5-formyltetrahydrofolate cyclo-ligase [Hyphomicrobium sp.]|nr:5-formyltetrahydrofolate cyclo-ligase [Hyphomicrobium sp.]